VMNFGGDSNLGIEQAVLTDVLVTFHCLIPYLGPLPIVASTAG
jgi:predicted PurR-regulated permease PerM